MFLDGSATASGMVHHNVIQQALSAVSFAGDYVTGPWRIFRNLVDLRVPTAGIRPLNASFNRDFVWRIGATFKPGNVPEGTYDIFQNTFIVPFAADFRDGQLGYPQASFVHLRNALGPSQTRSSLNNVFVVLNRAANQEAPIAFLLPPQTNVNINGDLFFRKGYGSRLFATPIPGDAAHFNLFSCALSEDCLTKWHANTFFQSTQSVNPPGYEAAGVLLQDPQFNSWAGETNDADDFRLKPSSPARAAGTLLPTDLQKLDLDSAGIALPDIGAYQTLPSTGLAPKLKVGVYGRRVYPQTGAGQ